LRIESCTWWGGLAHAGARDRPTGDRATRPWQVAESEWNQSGQHEQGDKCYPNQDPSRHPCRRHEVWPSRVGSSGWPLRPRLLAGRNVGYEHLPQWLKNDGAQLSARTAKALSVAGAALLQGITVLLGAIESKILGELTNPVRQVQSTDQPNTGTVNALAIARNSNQGGNDPKAQADAASGFGASWSPAFSLGLVIQVCSTVLSVAAGAIGPVAPLIVGGILVVLQASGGSGSGPMSAYAKESASAVLTAAGSFATYVVGSDNQEKTNIQLLEVLVGGAALIGALVVNLIESSTDPGNPAAIGLALELAMMALAVVTFTPSANITILHDQVSFALILAALSMVADLVGGLMYKAINWIAMAIIAILDAAVIYLAIKAG
jgi:hypothetical protein